MSSVRLRKEIKVRLQQNFEKWVFCCLVINMFSLLELSKLVALLYDSADLVNVFFCKLTGGQGLAYSASISNVFPFSYLLNFFNYLPSIFVVMPINSS